MYEEHWDDVYLNNKTLIAEMRPNVNYEINKIIDCVNKIFMLLHINLLIVKKIFLKLLIRLFFQF